MFIFFEFILTYFTDYNIVLNEKDLEWFRKINKNSICIPTSLKPSVFFKNFRKRKFKTSSIKWIAVGAVESRKDPYLFIDIAKKSEQYIQMILLHGLVMGHYLKTLI